MTDNDLRVAAAARALAVIEGLECTLNPRERRFVEEMRKAAWVSKKQLRWLQLLEEKVFD